MNQPTVIERLAARAVGMTDAPLPPSVAEATFGLVANGFSQLVARPSVAGSLDRWAHDDQVIEAGIAIHRDDDDDTDPFGGTHPTAVLLPAALAVVARRGEPVDGVGMLAALAAGYEVTGRLARMVPHVLTRTGFHATSVFGTLGAAVTAGLVNGLDESGLVDALGIAASQSSGVIQSVSEGGDLKLFHCGWAAASGVAAARWAARGELRPPRAAVEGAYGLLNGFALRPGIEARFDDLDAPGFVVEGIEAKRHPCCHFLHATIELLLEFREWHRDVDIDRVELVCTLPLEARDVVCEPWAERLVASGYDRKFSLPQIAARTLIYGPPEASWFGDEAALDPRAEALARRVSYRLSEAAELRRGYGAEIEIRVDGQIVFGGRRESAAPAGVAAIRDGDFLRRKFLRCVTDRGLGAVEASQRWDDLRALPASADVRTQLAALLA